jgi:hypothetical protein
MFMLTSVPAWRELTVPRKTVGTLTSSNSESVHTSIFPTVLYKSFAVATPEHSGPLPLGRIVAFAPDLRRASFHGVSRSPSPQHHYGTLITSDAHKRALSEPQSLTTILGSRHQLCGCYRTQIHSKSPRRSVPPTEAITETAYIFITA